MKVRDVMSVHVSSVGPTTTVPDALRLLQERGIGGMPVLDDGGRPVGVVSLSDLRPPPSPNGGPEPRTVADVMSADVVFLGEEMGLREAVRLLERRGVKRAPVLRGDRVVGFVSRSDLLRGHLRTDSEIRAEVELDVLVRTLGLSPRRVSVSVDRGVVGLSGRVPRADVKRLLERLVAAVDGVVDVVDRTEVEEPVEEEVR
ncbi:MAG: CBS domain-containing protein [Actinobacteria bacterium]|nr:CBS domain-containing protein [Actinomycetota bacterium]